MMTTLIGLTMVLAAFLGLGYLHHWLTMRALKTNFAKGLECFVRSRPDIFAQKKTCLNCFSSGWIYFPLRGKNPGFCRLCDGTGKVPV